MAVTALDFGGRGLQVAPEAAHHFTMVFLHGLGDSANGWVSGIFELREHSRFVKDYFKFILPTADTMPVHWAGGFPTTAWFDIYEIDNNDKEDVDTLTASRKRVESIVANEIASGIPSERVFVGGFSQGGAVSYDMLLNTDFKLGGALMLSTWVVGSKALYGEWADWMAKPVNRSTPALVCHGTGDEVVRFQWGKESFERVKRHYPKAEFKTYPMPHSASPSELSDVAIWLEATAKPEKSEL